MGSPRVQLIRRLFELAQEEDLSRAAEELLEHSREDVVYQPHSAQGEEIRGHQALRDFWAQMAEGGTEVRAGAYSIVEEGDAVIVSGWLRTTERGRLADSQHRWVYRFDDQDRVVSARVDPS